MNPVQDSTPLVSVIITLYNAGRYIEESLLSICRQTYDQLEIIVVNDGSSDDGPSIVERIAQMDGRIRLIQQANKGQCAASNAGFKQSRGTYVKFFDADDILTPGTISNQVKALEGKTENDASYIDYIRFYDDDLSTTNRYVLPALINSDCMPIEYIKFHGTPQMYNNALWLFHRKIFEKSGLWDERLSVNNDGEFFPRVLKYVNRLYYAPGSLVYYRTNFNSGSLSQTVSLKGLQSALLSVDLMAAHVRTLEVSEAIEKIIAQSYAQVLEMSFPAEPSITKQVEERLQKFDKSYYSISKSGRLYNTLRSLLGWKFARRMQIQFYKLKYRAKVQPGIE